MKLLKFVTAGKWPSRRLLTLQPRDLIDICTLHIITTLYIFFKLVDNWSLASKAQTGIQQSASCFEVSFLSPAWWSTHTHLRYNRQFTILQSHCKRLLYVVTSEGGKRTPNIDLSSNRLRWHQSVSGWFLPYDDRGRADRRTSTDQTIRNLGLQASSSREPPDSASCLGRFWFSLSLRVFPIATNSGSRTVALCCWPTLYGWFELSRGFANSKSLSDSCDEKYSPPWLVPRPLYPSDVEPLLSVALTSVIDTRATSTSSLASDVEVTSSYGVGLSSL